MTDETMLTDRIGDLSDESMRLLDRIVALRAAYSDLLTLTDSDRDRSNMETAVNRLTVAYEETSRAVIAMRRLL